MNQNIQACVIKVSNLTDRIKEFRLAAQPNAPLPEFEPGAHIRILLPNGDLKCYSLIKWPDDDTPNEFRIAVLLDPEGQGGSTYMHGLAAGDTINFEPPKNEFPLETDTATILLAGGIGVTPMISMATQLLAQGQDFEFHYAARSRDLVAYADELQAAFGAHLQFHFDDEPDTALDLKNLIGDMPKANHLYLCGPQGMIEAAKGIAQKAGVAPERIHFELFNAPQSKAEDQAFEVELASTGQVFTIPADKTIVQVLDEAGVDIMFDCQRGDCGICQTEVISGVPDHRDVILSDDEKAAGDVMQICVSRAKTARLVLDI